MKKFLILIPFLLFADIDPFAAGIKSGYGLTPDEKAILQNKKSIQNLRNEFIKLSSKLKKLQSQTSLKFVEYDQQISILNEKLSAFNSIIDDLSALKADLIKNKKKYKNFNQRLTDIENNISKLSNELNSLKNRVSILEDSLSQVVDIQNKNFNALKSSIQDILKQLKNFSGKKLSPKEAFYKARRYFFDGKLEKARELFLYSLNNGYLKATSSYYLGEIAYKKKRYKEALAFYKKSISIYPKKASFTARLLYHTAISFKKLHNKNAAILTLKKLISDFPNSKYANLAKKELEKLK